MVAKSRQLYMHVQPFHNFHVSTLQRSTGMGCRAKTEAAKPSIAAIDDVHTAQTGIETEAAAAAGTVSSSPEATLKTSDDGEVLVSVEPAATVQKNDTAASTPVQVSEGYSSMHNGSADVNDAPAAALDKTAAEAPSVVVQISDVDKGTSDGEVEVNIVSATPSQKPAEPAASSLEVSDGHTDKADGIVRVLVTAVTADQTAGAPESDTGAGTACGQQEDPCNNSLAALHPRITERWGIWGRGSPGTAFREVGSQPTMFNRLMDDSNQAGSEVEAGSASGNRASKHDGKAIASGPGGIGSDEDDDTVVQVTVDRSLLG